MKRLKTALLGFRGIGAHYLDVLCNDDQFELIAVGDADTRTQSDRHSRLADRLSAMDVRYYTDPRSLIVETAREGLDVLVVALEPRESVGFVTLAGEHGINVFHRAPFALNVEQGRKLIRLFTEHDAKIVVARPWMFEPAFATFLSPESPIGPIYAATAFVTICEQALPVGGDEERADAGCDYVGRQAGSAGRRALLYDAYEAIDLMVHLLGMPSSVYAQCAAAGDRQAGFVGTQDAVMVTLRFADDLVGSIAVLGGSADLKADFVCSFWTVTISGAGGTVTLSPGRQAGLASGVRVLPDIGKSVPEPDTQTARSIARALSAFAGAILSGVQEVKAAAAKHLATVATIDAAYLSAKTGAPESPGRLLD